MGHRISDVVLDEKTIRGGVARLAEAIDGDLAGRPAVLVGVLTGAVFFLCDLARCLRAPVSLDFVEASSYGPGTRPGDVRLLREPSLDLEGRDVVVVEDIVDTGATMRLVRETLRKRKPRSLRICSLLRKNTPRASSVPIDYLGFEIPDRFVVGYGLDYAGSYRNLPYVAAIEVTKGKP